MNTGFLSTFPYGWCPQCDSGKVAHVVEYDYEGNSDNAFFECSECGEQWSNITLSHDVLAITVPIEIDRDGQA